MLFAFAGFIVCVLPLVEIALHLDLSTADSGEHIVVFGLGPNILFDVLLPVSCAWFIALCGVATALPLIRHAFCSSKEGLACSRTSYCLLIDGKKWTFRRPPAQPSLLWAA